MSFTLFCHWFQHANFLIEFCPTSSDLANILLLLPLEVKMFNDFERYEDTSLGKKRCCDWLVFFVPCPATNQVFLAFDMQYVPYISWLFLAMYSIFVLYFCQVLFDGN